MRLEDIFERPLTVESGITVSKLVSKMVAEKKHEVLVLKGKELAGIITARDLVKTKISNPEKSGIKSFINQISPIHVDTDINDIVNTILINDYKVVPVMKDDKIFVVHKLELLKMFKNETELRDKTVNDVMNFPFCVDVNDTVSTARAMIRDMDVSRVVVVDPNDRIVGVVDTLAMLKSVIGKEKVSRGEGRGEKIKLDDLPVKSIASNDFITTAPDTPIKEAVSEMINKNNSSLLVERNGKLAGLVTPKDILKLIGKVVEGVYVTISGMQDEDDFIKSVVSDEIEHEIRKLGKIMPLSYFAMHIRKYHKTGKRIKYSVQARLITEKGHFFADDFAWDLTKATRGVLKKIEKELIRREGKLKVYRRGP